MDLSAPPAGARPFDAVLVRELLAHLAEADANARAAVNLVPSETRLSPLASIPLRTDFYNRYFFNDALDPSFWQFRGAQSVFSFETEVAMPALRALADAEHVNLRPISGMSAMLVAMSGLGGPPGGTVVSIRQQTGGHYATESVARRLGFTSTTVAVRQGRLDPEELRACLRSRPNLIYLDLQNSRHVLDIAAVTAEVARLSPETLVHADCSHTLGLVLGRALPNPLDLGADTMGGSTHKTFPGPHKGVLFTRRAELAQRLRAAQFTLLSSHHFAETMALGLAAVEFGHFGPGYARRTIANARALEPALAARGFDTLNADGHSTETHQVWVRAGDAERTDALAETLYQAGIRVNVQVDLPEAPGPVLRLGLGEVTFEGAGEATMHCLASAFAHARDGDLAGLMRVAADLRGSMGEPCYFTGLDAGDVAGLVSLGAQR
ncbi:MAG TPA: hypothetical protein VFC19_32020 [Candidatus Limnocylindrales bacterium]|nr:hypothetical protein [Candidatus Limnocylindrales bacterium]